MLAYSGKTTVFPNISLIAFVRPLPNETLTLSSFRIRNLMGLAKTPALTPVRTQVPAVLPVATPAAIMWSAAAQKSGLPGDANPVESGARLKAPVQVENMVSQEH